MVGAGRGQEARDAVGERVPEGQRFGPPQLLYVWLTALFCAALIVSNIVGVKLFRVGAEGGLAVVHTCGILTFPITFLLTDLLNEYYGRRAARRAVYISLVMAVFVFGVLVAATEMPRLDAPFNVEESAFDRVLGSSKIMFVASLTAYLVGSLCDIWLFGILKRLTRGRFVWLRANGSTVASQVIDSLIVTYLAFRLGPQLLLSGGEGGTQPMPVGEVLRTAATGYVLKFVLAIGVTPLIYFGRHVMASRLGMTPVPPESDLV